MFAGGGRARVLAEDGQVYTLALLQAYVPNQGNAWDYTVNHLVRFLEDRRAGVRTPPDIHPGYLATIRVLGRRTAQLTWRSAAEGDPAFVSEPLKADHLREIGTRLESDAQATFAMLADTERLAEQLRNPAAAALAARERILARIVRDTAQLPQTIPPPAREFRSAPGSHPAQ